MKVVRLLTFFGGLTGLLMACLLALQPAWAQQTRRTTIVGQLPLPDGEVEQFGAVLAKDSPLTGCVSGAVDALREDGILDQINQEWLAQQGAPELS